MYVDPLTFSNIDFRKTEASDPLHKWIGTKPIIYLGHITQTL